MTGHFAQGAAEGQDLATILKLGAFMIIVRRKAWKFFMTIEFVDFIIELSKLLRALIASDPLEGILLFGTATPS